MREVGGWLQGFRAQVLLQPFADSVADGAAGGAIDRLADFVDSAVHVGSARSFPLRGQVIGLKFVSPAGPGTDIFSKDGMNARKIVPDANRKKRETKKKAGNKKAPAVLRPELARRGSPCVRSVAAVDQ